MSQSDVKSDFSEAEARRARIRMILKGDGGTNGDTVLLAAVLEAQEEEMAQLRAALHFQGEAFNIFKALVCKAAWALSLPGSTGGNHTGFPDGVGAGHIHDVLNDDALDAFAALAALDTSGYAPCEGPAPNGGSNTRHAMFTQPGPTGYQADAKGGPCDLCGEPASEHGCPAVPA